MPKISLCVKSTEEAPADVIRLVRVGGGFLRAYNRSAWKFHRFICDYKVKRMYVKSVGEEVVSLGFPEGSLHSLAEGRQLGATELGYDLSLRPEETLDAEDYGKWVAALPLTNNSATDADSLPLSCAEAEREVIRRLVRFPLERKTPLECQQFVSEMREILCCRES